MVSFYSWECDTTHVQKARISLSTLILQARKNEMIADDISSDNIETHPEGSFFLNEFYQFYGNLKNKQKGTLFQSAKP